MLTSGWSSEPGVALSRSKSQSSSLVSSEKSASTAPALVPVITSGLPEPGDQANTAVRGISRNRTMASGVAARSAGPWLNVSNGEPEKGKSSCCELPDILLRVMHDGKKIEGPDGDLRS